jgi:2-polyprenyl-3-methyl-5-hydroxy-6-metoxy-1,4-benzoquinol methylase
MREMCCALERTLHVDYLRSVTRRKTSDDTNLRICDDWICGFGLFAIAIATETIC